MTSHSKLPPLPSSLRPIAELVLADPKRRVHLPVLPLVVLPVPSVREDAVVEEAIGVLEACARGDRLLAVHHVARGVVREVHRAIAGAVEAVIGALVVAVPVVTRDEAAVVVLVGALGEGGVRERHVATETREP